MTKSGRWHLGLICLGAVVLVWVASGFLIQAMSKEWAKPYFVTYFTTATFVVYLYPTLAKQRRKTSTLISENEPLSPTLSASSTNTFTTYDTAVLGCQFGVLWFTSNLLNNASYMYTSVPTATILACTSSFFTLIIGSVFKIERFTYAKLGALCLSILGVCLVTRSLGSEPASKDSMLGNLLALGSALLYGVYSTLLKVKVGQESNLDSKLFLGFVGLFNIVVLWPLLILLHYWGVETFELPGSFKIWALLLINGSISLAGDLLWVLAMLMTSPLVVTVGLGATIPLSMLGELLFSKSTASLMYCVGAACVCWSFIVINREEEHDHQILGQNDDDDENDAGLS